MTLGVREQNEDMENRINSDYTTTNESAVISRTDYNYGTASGLDARLSTSPPASATLSLSEYFYYFYCEYLKGILFLVLSITFILAVPVALSRISGLTSMMYKFAKRSMDIVGSMLALIVTLPFWIVIALMIKLDSRGPVFYTQVRVGLNRRRKQRRFCQESGVDERRSRDQRREDYLGIPFKVIKFRTMALDAEKATGPIWAAKNDPRVTRIGRLLRKSRIDEIPQFINILKGEMSLVGPRPERPEFVSNLVKEVDGYADRLRVTPGLTGMAQVHSGYDSSIASVAKKIKLDNMYIETCSVWTDFKIIMKTFVVVLTGRGAQ